MKIFLDTNIFYNDWFMRNADFKYLFHFLNNNGHELVISKLVIEESQNIRNRELGALLIEIKRNARKAYKYKSTYLKLESDMFEVEDYDLRCLLRERVDFVKEVDYEAVAHSEVVSRALQNQKPFMEGEKGYRDTLIWISFLEYLNNNRIDEDVVFITNNKSDFFKVKKDDVQFHKDLKQDIRDKGVKANILPFTSLYYFVNSMIDKGANAFDHYNPGRDFEEFLELSGAEYLEGMSNIDLANYFENSLFENHVKTILSVRTEVFEGLEDPEVIQTEQLNEKEVYVSYSYNLRRLIVTIDIPESDYILNKSELKKIFYDVEINSGVATLSTVVRPYFVVSFTFDMKSEYIENYNVADLWLRH